MPEKKEINVIILAGGKSLRMMQDKGLIVLQGKRLIEHVIEKAKKVTGNILLITQNPAYRQFGYPCYTDAFKEKGPLGGIFTGLTHSSAQKNLVLGCDMPFLSENILAALIHNSKNEDALVTEHEGKAEPLCAIYDRRCILPFSRCIEQDKLKITDALQTLDTRFINFDKEPWITGNEFVNINSAEELKKYQNNKTNNLE